VEVLLVRHAIAYPRDPARWPDDADRPLAPRGIERARRAAAGLKALTAPPQQVWASPLERTRATAAILTQYARWPPGLPCAALRPGAEPKALLALLSRCRRQRLALVGHEPDLGELVAACLGCDRATAFAFRKMGIAALEFRGGVHAGRARLLWYAPPRLLRALR